MQPLPSSFPFSWAVAYGEDPFGLWQAFEVMGEQQRLRWIAPGQFWMGSPETETDRGTDEAQHQVKLTRGLWLADTTCTQALWYRVLQYNPSRFRQHESHPVERVSLDDVTLCFLPRLNSLVPGLIATLPTEAEWEYACRADSARSVHSRAFWFGNRATRNRVNFRIDATRGGTHGSLTTVQVKSLPPNPWGLYEMQGNLWQWCLCRYREYDPLRFLTTDPPGGDTGTKYVLRGGSWFNVERRCRAAARDARDSTFSADYAGFRLCVHEGLENSAQELG